MEANVNNKNELYQTKDLVSVFSQCDFTRNNQLMTGLLADTGMGKTTSLKAYVTSNKDTFMVTVDKTMNAKRLYLAILAKLGVQFDGNIHDVMLQRAN
jgi:DNA transposition AAA+ family ATPase